MELQICHSCKERNDKEESAIRRLPYGAAHDSRFLVSRFATGGNDKSNLRPKNQLVLTHSVGTYNWPRGSSLHHRPDSARRGEAVPFRANTFGLVIVTQRISAFWPGNKSRAFLALFAVTLCTFFPGPIAFTAKSAKQKCAKVAKKGQTGDGFRAPVVCLLPCPSVY